MTLRRKNNKVFADLINIRLYWIRYTTFSIQQSVSSQEQEKTHRDRVGRLRGDGGRDWSYATTCPGPPELKEVLKALFLDLSKGTWPC